ncbi:MAG: maleate isomerase [Actinomycetota bacterium]|nr:maleate isomerase [Actinomycetota bacterium]
MWVTLVNTTSWRKLMSILEAACETSPEPKRAGSSRVGLIVPSSNTTMETELPELFRRQSEATGHKYTFHSARAGMKKVTKEELLAMVGKAAGCAEAVSDADVDVIAYACLVAVMAQGPNAHVGSEQVIADAAAGNGHPAPVTSSAGALVRTLQAMGARKVAMITPYMKPLTQMVVEYIEGAGITVIEATSLEVADNLAVGCLDPQNLPEIARNLKRDGADAIVLSACVQMPSLPAVQAVEDELGLPVITAATATTYEILKALGHTPNITGAGSLLSGARTLSGSGV